MMICTKHAGSRHRLIRGGEPISSKTIALAIEGSLKRLQTDFIDLYLFHWPNRGSYSFRNNWSYDPSDQDRSQTSAHFDDALEALSKQVDKGNIRNFGLSNETTWGWVIGVRAPRQPVAHNPSQFKTNIHCYAGWQIRTLQNFAFKKMWASWPIHRWRVGC